MLPTFHYALKPDGYLLLGTSETITGFHDLFSVVNRKERIYAKKPGSGRLALDFVQREPAAAPATTAVPALGETGWTAPDAQREADRLLLARYTPPSVLVNEDLEIVQFRGRTGPFLEPAQGRASLNLLKMAHEGLVVDLRNAIQQAKRRHATVRKEGIQLTANGRSYAANLEVVPVQAPDTRARHFLVLFEQEAPTPVAPAKARVAADRRVAALEAELGATKEYLQSLIEEFEGANEELKASNEEVRSSNEELQCTNEELETAKEELQSTNEELTTVNEELQTRNQELGQLNDDINNLLTSTQIPIVMLGADLRIRRFTPTAEKVLNLIPTDVGRPITDLKLTVDVPDLEKLIADALDTLSVKEREVQDRRGRWYALRVRPYRTSDNKIDGTVVALMDIDEVKRSLTAARAARDFAEAIIETSHEPLLVLTGDLRIKRANRAFYERFHVSKKETVGSHIYDLGHGQWDIPRLRKLLERILPKNVEFREFPVTRKFPDIGQRNMLLNARRLVAADQTTPLILLTIEDVTARQRAAIIEFSSDAISAVDLTGKYMSWNKGAEQMYGYTADEVLGRSVSMLIPPDRVDELPALLKQTRQGQVLVGYQTVRVRKDGQRLDVSLTLSPMRAADGRLIGSSAVARDITERKRLETEIQHISEIEKQRLGQDLHDGLSQQLTGIRYLAVALEDSLKEKSLPDAGDAAKLIRELKIAATQTHDLAHGLFPVELRIGGLWTAFQQLAASTTNLFKISCRVVGSPKVHITDVDLARQLYRIVQEATHNAAKHSQGKHIVIQLVDRRGQITLTVKDDGQGIVPNTLRKPGMGLRIMQYRASLIGANLKIARAPGGGTLVTCNLPPPTAAIGENIEKTKTSCSR